MLVRFPLRLSALCRLIQGAAWLFVVAVVLWPLVSFYRVACARLTYPFELEWMEGAVVDHVRIILSGQSLYRQPTLEFTPFIYVPGYYYVSAAVTKLIGIGFVAPRLVSLIAITACFMILYSWVKRESGQVLAALVAVGLFAATYGLSAYWFDLARVDSLCLSFLLGGYFFARFGSAPRHCVYCGVLLGCAAITKQVALLVAIPALGFILLKSRKRGLVAAFTFLLVIGVVFGLLQFVSRGWFGFYAFMVPADHQIEWTRWRSDLERHFWTSVAPMALCAVAVVFGMVKRLGFKLWAFYAGWLLIVFATALSSLLHTGGYPNVLMPFHASIAICAGLVFAQWWGHGSVRATEVQADSPIRRRLLAVAIVLIQLALLPSIRPRDLIPTTMDHRAGQFMLATVKSSPGPVWMIASGYYPMLTHNAGVTGHSMAFVDILKSKRKWVIAQLRQALIDRIRAKHFGSIVLDRADGFLPPEMTNEIRRNYHFKRQIFSVHDTRLMPKSGASVRPNEIWEPNVPLRLNTRRGAADTRP